MEKEKIEKRKVEIEIKSGEKVKKKESKYVCCFLSSAFRMTKTVVVFRGEFTSVLISAERVPFWIAPSDRSTENEDENKRFLYVTVMTPSRRQKYVRKVLLH